MKFSHQITLTFTWFFCLITCSIFMLYKMGLNNGAVMFCSGIGIIFLNVLIANHTEIASKAMTRLYLMLIASFFINSFLFFPEQEKRYSYIETEKGIKKAPLVMIIKIPLEIPENYFVRNRIINFSDIGFKNPTHDHYQRNGIFISEKTWKEFSYSQEKLYAFLKRDIEQKFLDKDLIPKMIKYDGRNIIESRIQLQK